MTEGIAREDAEAIGLKVVEMADRVKTLHAVVPGSRARWYFDMDDLRFEVIVKQIPRPGAVV